MQGEPILDHTWIFRALAQSESRMAYRASYGSEEIGQERIVIMEKLSKTVSFARVVREGDCSVFEVLGASVEFLLGPEADDEAPCIIRGTMPPGVSVPIHSHKAVEVFFILSGNIEVLIEDGGKMSWVEASAGNLIEIPSKAKHAFRNRSQHPVINLPTRPPSTGATFRKSADPRPLGKALAHHLPMKFSVSWIRRGVTATGLGPRKRMHQSALLSSRYLHQSEGTITPFISVLDTALTELAPRLGAWLCRQLPDSDCKRG